MTAAFATTRENCLELAQLCCPIMLGQQAIGVIGLIAFSREQQLELVSKGARLLQFIRKMAELVAAKAAEKDGLNRTVFLKNQVGNGVALCSGRNCCDRSFGKNYQYQSGG